MSRTYLTKEQEKKIQRYLDEGKEVKWISLTLGIKYNIVYYFRERSYIKERHLLSRNNKWSEEHVEILKARFEEMPFMWRRSVEFRTVCRELGRSKNSVEQKCKALGLTKFDPPPAERPEPEKVRFRRPEPVYTNIKTPYGIASDLHRGNRIY